MATDERLADAMLQQVQARLATPVTDDEELERLKKGIDGVIERSATLRGFELTNADEPFFVFSAGGTEVD